MKGDASELSGLIIGGVLGTAFYWALLQVMQAYQDHKRHEKSFDLPEPQTLEAHIEAHKKSALEKIRDKKKLIDRMYLKSLKILSEIMVKASLRGEEKIKVSLFRLDIPSGYFWEKESKLIANRIYQEIKKKYQVEHHVQHAGEYPDPKKEWFVITLKPEEFTKKEKRSNDLKLQENEINH